MELPLGNFELDFNELLQLNRDGINDNRVITAAYQDPGIEWYSTKDPQSGDRRYYIVGFSSSAQFLFVLLKEHKEHFNRLVIERVFVIRHEREIRKLYYEPKFKKR